VERYYFQDIDREVEIWHVKEDEKMNPWVPNSDFAHNPYEKKLVRGCLLLY
jgi:hypothetical protein